MRFSLGKLLRHMYSYPSLVCMCLTISSAFVGGISQWVVQIPSMDMILMGYWVANQARNMMSSVMLNSKFSMGKMILRRVLVMPCEILLRNQLSGTSSIALIGSVRGTASDLGDTL